MDYTITLIPGDGIGPEVAKSAVSCIDAAAKKHNFSIKWDTQYAGETAMKKFGSVMPEKTLKSIRSNGVALKGPITTPIGEGFRSVNVELRQTLGLYANVRPAMLFRGIKSRYSKVNLVVIRENTEDLYAGIEFDVGKKHTYELIEFVDKKTGKRIKIDSAIALKPISASASRKIVEFAFSYAKANKRKHITAVHKANIMKFTDGLFLRTAENVAAGFPSIKFDSMIIDNLCMQLVTKPENFDVLVCPNLYGDILSDLCAGLVGGLGLAPSANIGEGCAIFEPVHGSSPKHAGKNEVNPTACILSGALLLHHIGQDRAAQDIERAVGEVLAEGRVVTYDINPKKPAATTEMTAEIINRLGVK